MLSPETPIRPDTPVHFSQVAFESLPGVKERGVRQVLVKDLALLAFRFPEEVAKICKRELLNDVTQFQRLDFDATLRRAQVVVDEVKTIDQWTDLMTEVKLYLEPLRDLPAKIESIVSSCSQALVTLIGTETPNNELAALVRYINEMKTIGQNLDIYISENEEKWKLEWALFSEMMRIKSKQFLQQK